MAVQVRVSESAVDTYDDGTEWAVDERDRALAVYAPGPDGQLYERAVYAPGAWQSVVRDAPPAPAQ